MFVRNEILREFHESTLAVPAARMSIDFTNQQFETDKDREWDERFELAEHIMDHEH